MFFKKGENVYFWANDTVGTQWNTRSGMKDTGEWTFITAVRSGSRTALFAGAELPAESHFDRWTGWATGTNDSRTVSSKLMIGGHNYPDDAEHIVVPQDPAYTYAEAARCLKGTVKAVRVYNRVLTTAELEQNRAIDNVRFKLGALKYTKTGGYVANGLVVHLDGINNAGRPDSAHDDSAEKWANLADGDNPALIANDSGKGGWVDGDGYCFTGGVCYAWLEKATPAMHEATFEFVSDVNTATGQTGTWLRYISGRDDMSIHSKNANDGPRNKLRFKSSDWTGNANDDSGRAQVENWDGRNASFVFGGVCTDSASIEELTGLHSYTNGVESQNRTRALRNEIPATRWMIANEYDYSADALKGDNLAGVVKSVRIYSRALSAAEVKWNNAVDNARFSGAAAPEIPVTNAVIASSVSGVEGHDGSGVYAVDGEYTFSATEERALGGKTYSCIGYVLESWDGDSGAWTGAVLRAGSLCTVTTNGPKVRITWQWRETSGEPSRVYGTDDYVQDGLVLHYDGIRNAGRDAAHDASAAAWRDVSGNCNDATLSTNGNAYGMAAWDADGFVFASNAWFDVDAPLDAGDSFTVQFALAADKYHAGTPAVPYSFLVSACDSASIGFDAYWNAYNSHRKLYLYADSMTKATGGNGTGRAYIDDTWGGRYATLVFEPNGNGGLDAYNFEGTTYPTAHPGKVAGGTTSAGVDGSTALWTFGSVSPNSGSRTAAEQEKRLFTGTMKSVRVYSRRLTEEELSLNRAIDEARLFSDGDFDLRSGTQTVWVCSNVAGLNGNESGRYFIPAGASYVFSAPAGDMTMADGRVYRLTGYTLETWNYGSQKWNNAESHVGACFKIDIGYTGWRCLRLTWQYEFVRGIVRVDGSDYVQDGLLLHCDGIANAGAYVPHDSSATTWANLADASNPAEFHWYDGNSHADGLGTGTWTGDGFAFAGGTFAETANDLDLGTKYTIQVVCDANKADQGYRDGEFFITSTNPAASSLFFKPGEWPYFWADDTVGTQWNTRSGMKDTGEWDFITAVRDGSRTALFSGAELPAGSNLDRWNGWAEGTGDVAMPASKWMIGGHNYPDDAEHIVVPQDPAYTYAEAARCIKGTVKSVRIYNRVLCDADLAKNRAVDEARAAAASAGGYVVQVANFGDAVSAAPGAYAVAGSWSFSAWDATTESGAVRALLGYSISTWNDDAGGWNAPTFVPNAGGVQTYSYIEGESPAKVRLTWKWKANGLFVMFL